MLRSLRFVITASALSAAALTLTAAPREAAAFCGFYISGGESKLFNNATVVVMMRDGTRTVLSMQNNYQGPPQDFAMVVPVPVILSEKDVKILPPEIFDRVDMLAAPRLVEYWEEDPCHPEYEIYEGSMALDSVESTSVVRRTKSERDLGVTIEARFAVGEYQILILSAKDAAGLDTWLRDNRYAIPPGAAEVLRPYVQTGMKFFVAKVDADKVRFKDGQAMLSPLRFHYDSPGFSLPVRLGLINSAGTQDLLVHILARGVRYEVANYPNVAIPTNLEVADSTRKDFARFYAALYDRVAELNPGAVITEYAWSAGSCDPCPQEPLSAAELTTLGADVLPTYEAALRRGTVESSLAYQMPGEFVLTRLHARYRRDGLGEDLVFQAAPAIVGGREVQDAQGAIEQGAQPSPYGQSTFQARYVIRHPWAGPIECEAPVRGRWGGPPAGIAGSQQPAIATDLAFVDRSAELSSFLGGDVPELELTAAPALPSGPVQVPPPDPKPVAPRGGCSRCDVGELEVAGGVGFVGLAVVLGVGLRRRRRGG